MKLVKIIFWLFLGLSLTTINAIRPDHLSRIFTLTQNLPRIHYFQLLNTAFYLNDVECEVFVAELERQNLAHDNLQVVIEQSSIPGIFSQRLQGLDPDELRMLLFKRARENMFLERMRQRQE